MAGALSLCGHNAQYAISFTPNELEALLESYLAKPNMIPHAVRHIFVTVPLMPYSFLV